MKFRVRYVEFSWIPDSVRYFRTKSDSVGPNPERPDQVRHVPESSKSALHLISDGHFVSSRAYALTHAVFCVCMLSQVQVVVLVPFVKVFPRDAETVLVVVLVPLGVEVVQW